MTKAVRELKLSSFSVPTGDVGCFWRPAGIVLPRSCVELILYIARARVIYRSAGALRFIVAARVIARVMNHICATSFSPTLPPLSDLHPLMPLAVFCPPASPGIRGTLNGGARGRRIVPPALR